LIFLAFHLNQRSLMTPTPEAAIRGARVKNWGGAEVRTTRAFDSRRCRLSARGRRLQNISKTFYRKCCVLVHCCRYHGEFEN